jgi:hypothetical protein
VSTNVRNWPVSEVRQGPLTRRFHATHFNRSLRANAHSHLTWCRITTCGSSAAGHQCPVLVEQHAQPRLKLVNRALSEVGKKGRLALRL